MLYNFKSEEKVQYFNFECFCMLVEDLIDEFKSLRRGQDISFYAPVWIVGEVAVRLMDEVEELFLGEDSDSLVDFSNEDEVILTISFNGEMNIEEARCEDGRLKTGWGDDLNYLYDGFMNNDLRMMSDCEEYILVFGFEDEDVLRPEDEEVDTYHVDHELPKEATTNNRAGGNLKVVMDNTDDGMHGFTATESGDGYNMSYSFYSSEKLDMNDTMRILKMMGFGE